VKLDSSVLFCFAASALAAQLACGGSPATPTTPAPPITVPTPAPTPTPDSSIPPADSGCGEPYPPDLFRIAVKVHIKSPEYWTLDSTPQVGPNPEYCREVGYTDGREICPVRLEQDADRRACEAWVMGNAKDTGKPGPTWYYEWSQYCTTFAESGCEHNPDNPLSLFVRKGGWYQACRGDADDICGETEADK
jgi:hypothetical protein